MMHPLEFSVSRWKDGSIIIAFNKESWLEYSVTLMRSFSPVSSQNQHLTCISEVFISVEERKLQTYYLQRLYLDTCLFYYPEALVSSFQRLCFVYLMIF